ncbi:MAG: LysR family transcriptional regulator [Lentisphaerae bacterium]|nr:LysR family transcriptional regulator [Lentisphaerota bacterium]
MVSIKQIQNFLVLAEILHFAKAAAQLKISQATLSSEIKKLENKLGVTLFDRSDKWEIKLTIAGKSYYNSVKNIPGDIFKAQQEAVKSSRGESGSLAVAVSSIAYDYIDLGMICKKMALRYPEVRMKILDMPMSLSRFDCLCHENADIAIFAGSDNIIMPDGFTAKKLLPLNVALAIHPQSQLAKIEKLTIKDLKNTHFIMPPAEEAPNLRKAWDEIFMTNCGSLPPVTHEVIGSRGVLQFVAAGLGVGFVFMHNDNIRHENIIFRNVPVKLNRSLLAGFRDGSTAPVINNFLRLLSETLPKTELC